MSATPNLATQNAPARVAEQAAARAWYNRATRLSRWRLVVVFLLPTAAGLVGAAWGLWRPSVLPDAQMTLRAVSAMAALILWAVDELLWRPLIDSARRAAARAQEMFDTAVLGLPWNDLLVGPPHVDADVSRMGRILLARQEDAARLLDWYRPELQGLPAHLARVMAQRENLWWDRSLRKTYIWWAATPLLVVVALALGMLVQDRRFAEVVLILTTLLPATRAYTSIVRDNWAAIDRLQNILSYATRLKDRYVQHAPPTHEALAEGRRVQDAIFHHRSSAPVGLQRVYWTSRDANEVAYADEVTKLVRQVAAGSPSPQGCAT